MEREELAAWLRLSLTPGVGNETALRLLSAFGPPQAVFAQSGAVLRGVVSPALAQALGEEPEELASLLDATWRWLEGAQAPVWRHVAPLPATPAPC